MNCNYSKRGEVKANRVKVQEYLGKNFHFTEKSHLETKIDNYFERIINNFPMKIGNSDSDLTTDGNSHF